MKYFLIYVVFFQDNQSFKDMGYVYNTGKPLTKKDKILTLRQYSNILVDETFRVKDISNKRAFVGHLSE